MFSSTALFIFLNTTPKKFQNSSSRYIALCAMPLPTSNPQQVCISVGCVPPACCPYLPACNAQGVCLLLGGVCFRGGVYFLVGVCFPGGVCFLGESASEGVSAAGRVHIPSCTEADNPPVNSMTERQV